MTSNEWNKMDIPTVLVSIAFVGVFSIYFARSYLQCICFETAETREMKKKMKPFIKLEKALTDLNKRLKKIENDAEYATESSNLSSYYHFDSNGKKIPNKWDNFDIQKELDKIDSNEKDENKNENNNTKEKNNTNASILLQKLAGIEHEYEATLAFVDSIRGDEQVKAKRKEIALRVTSEIFPRIDLIRKKFNK